MKIMTNERRSKYTITALTLVAKRDGDSLTISFAPLTNLLPADGEENRLLEMVERVMKKDVDTATITATADGIKSEGFSTALPSYAELSRIMLTAFEELSYHGGKLLLALDHEDGREERRVAKQLMLAIAAGKISSLDNAIAIIPIDELLMDHIVGKIIDGVIIISLDGNAPMLTFNRHAGPNVTLAGAPSYYPEAWRTEIDQLVLERFMTFVEAERKQAIKALRASRKTRGNEHLEQAPEAAAAATDVGTDMLDEEPVGAMSNGAPIGSNGTATPAHTG